MYALYDPFLTTWELRGLPPISGHQQSNAAAILTMKGMGLLLAIIGAVYVVVSIDDLIPELSFSL